MPLNQTITEEGGEPENKDERTRLLIASSMLNLAQNQNNVSESEQTTSESITSSSDGNASDQNTSSSDGNGSDSDNRRAEAESNTSDSDDRRSGTDSNTSDSDSDAERGLKRMRKTVSFSPNVNLRYLFCSTHPQMAGNTVGNAHNTSLISSGWFDRDEVDSMRNRARNLSAMHHNILRDPTNFDASRAELGGDSLRGMEHLTDVSSGRKRRRIKDDAIQATIVEQNKQLIDRVLETYAASNSNSSDSLMAESRLKKRALWMDNRKLATMYRDNSKDALLHAKRVGVDDAKVAAEILSQDMNFVPGIAQVSSPINSTSPSSIS
mmetsp:Transcript_37863/g.79803  ORF Transcript_37863/g.79803 Transcript_37863/m.79803 type:complete len:323 (+) Transcript_37863:74-1042(+)